MKLWNCNGGILPLFAIGALTLLLAAGLAIDGGRLFVLQAVLQRAADVSALAAVKHVRDQSPDAVTEVAQGVFRDNLLLNNLSAEVPQVVVEPTTNPTQVEVATHMLAFPVFAKLPFVPREFSLTARARAEFDRVILTLLLDISGSMWCSADGDCFCLDLKTDPLQCRNGGTRPLRIDVLQEAVRALINQLDWRHDRLSIVLFDGANQIVLPFRPQQGFDRQAALSAVSGFTPGGGTATGYGLRVAREQFAMLPDSVRGVRSILLITDGAPIGEKPENHLTPRCRFLDFSESDPYRYNEQEASSDFLYGIWEADEVRRSGIRLDVIGFERASLVETDPTDPNYLYQLSWGSSVDMAYWLYANPFFGLRTSNSERWHQLLALDSAFPQYQGVHEDLSPCAEIPTANDDELKKMPRGNYLATVNGAELKNYVLSLGLRTQERLIE